MNVKNLFKNVLLASHPVGSIFITTDGSFDPHAKWGGTWELLQDSFLVGAGNTYTLGATGGEATHTLTINEMPNHWHQFGIGWTDGNKYSVSYTTNKSSDWSSVQFENGVGGNQPHNNLPPYTAVNMWLRTA